MEVQQDFKKLLELFNVHKVEYVIVGGYALAFHGVPRYTGDIDILVRPDDENARKVLAALDEFGFGSVGLEKSDFTDLGKVVQFGVPPIRIDIISSLTGVSWEEAFSDLVVIYDETRKKDFHSRSAAPGSDDFSVRIGCRG